MKKQSKISQSLLRVGLATVLFLMVPALAMRFTDAVHWGVADFIIMGALLFGTGSSYLLVTRYASSWVYQLAVVFALGAMLCMIWANLAVGLMGSGPNPGNLLYLGVIAIIIIGSILCRFHPRGMQRVMYTTAGSLVLVALIALLANMDEYPDSSVLDILAVNGFFAILFGIAGLLFHFAHPLPENSEG